MPRRKDVGPDYWRRKWQYQKESGEAQDDLERQKARREYDKKGIDRAGKHIDHKKKIKDGGKSTGGNLRLRSPGANMADNGKKKK